MLRIISRLFTDPPEKPLEYGEMRGQTGITIQYSPHSDGGVTISAASESVSPLEISFSKKSRDEAHILYMEVTELLRSRAKLGQNHTTIRKAVEILFGIFQGKPIPQEATLAAHAKEFTKQKPGEFVPNPGKKLEMDVDGTTYLRLPIKTRLITTADKNILPIIDEYVRPHLQDGDIVFVSEKALSITQGLVIDMSEVKPTPLARLLARNVSNYYGSEEFHGFGHGTDLAMQLFIEEAGVPRILFAAAVSAITRPFGIRGAFYLLSGKRAKSVDCPMSFLILEYAHSVKLAPNRPNGVAKQIKHMLGCDAVILDANYRGAFSLGKSSRALTESFIGKLFRDNPLGQSDEMTPFCIVRKK